MKNRVTRISSTCSTALVSRGVLGAEEAEEGVTLQTTGGGAEVTLPPEEAEGGVEAVTLAEGGAGVTLLQEEEGGEVEAVTSPPREGAVTSLPAAEEVWPGAEGVVQTQNLHKNPPPEAGVGAGLLEAQEEGGEGPQPPHPLKKRKT